MRHFIVLGFSTHSKNETGESIYLGSDREKAIVTTNDKGGGFARKELFEMAVPQMRRHFVDNPETAAKPKRTASKKA